MTDDTGRKDPQTEMNRSKLNGMLECWTEEAWLRGQQVEVSCLMISLRLPKVSLVLGIP